MFTQAYLHAYSSYLGAYYSYSIDDCTHSKPCVAPQGPFMMEDIPHAIADDGRPKV